MQKTLLVVLLISTFISGCRIGIEKNTQKIKDTVMRYNQLLAEGYSNMNMTPLRGVATEEHAQKVYHHMAALGEANLRMETRLLDIEFLDIQFPAEDLARLKTKERWNYTHININTNMPGNDALKEVTYILSYELVKNDGKWFVSSVSVLEGENQEDISAEKAK